MKNFNITNSASFADNQRKAVTEMKKRKLNVIAIPGGAGFYIVKPGTIEAREHQGKKLCLFTTTVDGEEYLICRA